MYIAVDDPEDMEYDPEVDSDRDEDEEEEDDDGGDEERYSFSKTRKHIVYQSALMMLLKMVHTNNYTIFVIL